MKTLAQLIIAGFALRGMFGFIEKPGNELGAKLPEPAKLTAAALAFGFMSFAAVWVARKVLP